MPIELHNALRAVSERTGTVARETKLLWREHRFRWFAIAATGFNLLAWLTALFIYRQSEDAVIALHHTVYFGINLIGEPYKVFALPLLGISVVIANTLFASLVRREGDFFADLFAVTAIIVNIFLLLGLGGITLVNFR